MLALKYKIFGGSKMKKITALILAVCMIFAFASCGKKENDTSSKDDKTTVITDNSSQNFVKPEKYASVLLVSINPQFKLYLGENGQVLAVEAVNTDAESIKSNINFENQNYEAVIKNIVNISKKNGFVKSNATIKLEIIEKNIDNTILNNILSNAEKAVKDVAADLNVNIITSVNDESVNNNSSSSSIAKSGSSSSSSPVKATTKTTVAKTSSAKPAHIHKYAAATCTTAQKCSCGAVTGKALGHSYKNGVCTRCKAKDPNSNFTSVLKKDGFWFCQYLDGIELYGVSLFISNSKDSVIAYAIGDLLSTLPEEMQNEPNILKNCELYNGNYYYVGKGDGDEISVSEANNTITLTDTKGKKLVLTRTGENTLKCTSIPDTFAYMLKIPAGTQFTFLNEQH